MPREDLQRKVDIAYLSAFYGGLLTERQRLILSLHCEEDLSLAEIAEEVGISRQAVHEALNHATDRLFRLEAQLGVAERFRRMQAGLENALDALNHHEDEQARQLIEALLALDQEDPDGI